MMEEDDKTIAWIKDIVWNCISEFKESFRKDICKPNHKEVDEVKEDIKDLKKCISKKFNWAYALLVSTLVAHLAIKLFAR